MLTSEEMARKLSVSLCTFSHALNGHPRVSERTRHRVMEAARENGFVPNHAARRLVRARFKPKDSCLSQVGFLFLDDGEAAPGPWCLLLLRGAEQALHEVDASLTFVRGGKSVGGVAWAALCKDRACKAPELPGYNEVLSSRTAHTGSFESSAWAASY